MAEEIKEEVDVLSIPPNYIEERIKQTIDKLISDELIVVEIKTILNWFLSGNKDCKFIVSNCGHIDMEKSYSHFMDFIINSLSYEFTNIIISKEIEKLSINDITKFQTVEDILKDLLIECGGKIALYNLINFIGFSTKQSTMIEMRNRLINNTL